MYVAAYYLGSVLLLGFSFYLFNGSAPWSQLGCSQYDKARRLRFAAIIMLILGLLGFGIAILAQVSASSL